MRHLITVFAIAVAGAGASAQPANPAADARARLLAADTDKDGKWSMAEWTAAGRRAMGFAFCDTGKDGFVDPAELKVCAEKARAMGMSGN